MKIKDIIHFYFGGSVLFDNKKGTIIRVSHSRQEPLIRIRFDIGGSCEAWVSEIKLLLRPLSSMTEEEAKDFIKKDDSGIGSKNISSITVREDEIEINIENTAYYIWFSSISPREYIWLISKSFDVFGLIESQQAIDITKLNKDAK